MYKRDRHQRTNSLATSEYEAHPVDESAIGEGRGARAETAAIEMAPAQVYVRPGRTPGKGLRAQAGPEGDRQSPPLLFSGGHPPAVTLADSTRVRFWRTPKHLMREIWGAPGSEEPAQRPGQAETPDVADVISVAEATAIEVEVLDIWPEGDTVAEALPVPEADVAPRSAPFAFLLAVDRVSAQMAELVTAFGAGPLAVTLLANLVLLIAGLFLDIGAAILLLAPLLLPVAAAAGLDPIQFGVVLVVNLMIHGLTPPLGILVYVVSGIMGVPASAVFRAVLPLLGVLLAALMVLSLGMAAWPALAPWAKALF